jgi:putative ATP-dependent endonuclease of the OLD family
MESLESRHASLAKIDLPNKRALVRMINSQNNEKIFFADRVVLVEGITDRLVMESLIAVYARRFSKVEAIEVVEVGGKAGFKPYKDLWLACELLRLF